MKMARASLKEAEAAVRLANVLEAVAKHHYPHAYDESNNIIDAADDPFCFDPDDVDHLRAFHDRVMDCLDGGLFRVTFGMLVLLDPKNEVVDQTKDHLELHPKYAKAAEELDELLAALKGVVNRLDMDAIDLREWLDPHRQGYTKPHGENAFDALYVPLIDAAKVAIAKAEGRS